MKRQIIYIVVVLLQIGFLLGMIASKQRILSTGYPVRLGVRPIDPMDLTRGEYVRLGYDISQLDLTKLSHEPGEYKTRADIYVTLSRDTKANSPLWIPKTVSKKKPGAGEMPFIKGTIMWENQWSNPSTRYDELNVDYTIGQYFVQEGRAKEIESSMRTWGQNTTHKVSVEVKLAEDGSPAISKLFIDEMEFK